jgi:hypothetical protein
MLFLQHVYATPVVRALRMLLLISLAMLGSGCAMMSNYTTLKTQMPAQFSVDTTAHYSPLFGGVCLLPEDYAGDPDPDRKDFYSPAHAEPFTTEFEVRVSYTVADCLAVLSGFSFRIQGQPGTDPEEFGVSTVEVEVETFLREDEEPAIRLDEQVLAVRCRWKDPEREGSKMHDLRCVGVDANGKERKGPLLGVLKNRQLQGLTLRLQVSVVDETPQT